MKLALNQLYRWNFITVCSHYKRQSMICQNCRHVIPFTEKISYSTVVPTILHIFLYPIGDKYNNSLDFKVSILLQRITSVKCRLLSVYSSINRWILHPATLFVPMVRKWPTIYYATPVGFSSLVTFTKSIRWRFWMFLCTNTSIRKTSNTQSIRFEESFNEKTHIIDVDKSVSIEIPATIVPMN